MTFDPYRYRVFDYDKKQSRRSRGGFNKRGKFFKKYAFKSPSSFGYAKLKVHFLGEVFSNDAFLKLNFLSYRALYRKRFFELLGKNWFLGLPFRDFLELSSKSPNKNFNKLNKGFRK